jgi:hypothetical protein
MSEPFISAKYWECKKEYICGLIIFILLNIGGVSGIIVLLNSQEEPNTLDYNIIFVTFTSSIIFISSIIFRCICIKCDNRTEEEMGFYEGFEYYN